MKCKLEKANIYYDIYGSGYPILMIHGFPIDHRVMKGCMEPIFASKENYKRIYFDLPGMGNTKTESSIKNSDHMLTIILEFIDKIIPDQHFIIASESYGSYLARGIIYKKFDMIDGVLFICPLIIPQPQKRDLPKRTILIKDSEVISRLNPLDTEEFQNISVIQSQRIWERFREEVLSALKVAEHDFTDAMFIKGYSLSFNVDDLSRKFNKPTLFLLGRQDSSVGYRDAWKIIENYPRATFVILDEAGHNLQIEKEYLFNDLVNDWLKRVEYHISIYNKK